MTARLDPALAHAATMTLHSAAQAEMWANHFLAGCKESPILKHQFELHRPFRDAAQRSAGIVRDIRRQFGGAGGEELAKLAKAPEGLAVILKAYMDGTDEMREAMEAFALNPAEYV